MGAAVVRRLRALAGRHRDEGGLTMVELLVSMAILGTVLTGVVGVFASGTRAQTDREMRFRAQIQLTTALGKLRREAHNACKILSGYTSSSITLNMPATVPPQPPDTPCTIPTQVTWCAIGSGSRYALYRVPGAACTTTGAKKYADFLTTSGIFPSPTYWPKTDSALARMQVSFTVDERPGDTVRAYAITDEIVLRNSIADPG